MQTHIALTSKRHRFILQHTTFDGRTFGTRSDNHITKMYLNWWPIC